MSTEPRKRGRQAEAERNNVRILEAAREVFIANPAAPISEVALRAGVGIAALYHRYPSKNALLAQLCLDGQDTYIELVEKALASTDDPWTAYVQWLRDTVAADTHALTVHLAGLFTPDERHAARTERMIRRHRRAVRACQADRCPASRTYIPRRRLPAGAAGQDQARRYRPDGRTQAAPTRHHHRRPACPGSR